MKTITDPYIVELYMDGKKYHFQWTYQALQKIRQTKGRVLMSGAKLVIDRNQTIQY